MDAWIQLAKRSDTLNIQFIKMEPFDDLRFNAALKNVGLSSIAGLYDSSERINSTPGFCDLREDYKNNMTENIEKKIPQVWRRLKEAQPILRPFLEKNGFNNLLWWD
jgi:hypothetical protein